MMNELRWGDPEVDLMLREHMQQYNDAGINQAYMSEARSWMSVIPLLGGDEALAEEVLRARSCEEYLVSTFEPSPLGLGMNTLKLQRVDSWTGIIVPNSIDTIAWEDGGCLNPVGIYMNCDLSVAVKAAEQIASLGLVLRTLSGR